MFVKLSLKNSLSWFVIGLFALHGSYLSGQEMLGLTMGNYNGLTGSLINPSIMTNTRNYLEVNVFSSGYFVRNTIAYIPGSDFSIWELLGSDIKFPVYGERNDNYLLYQNKDLKLATTNLRILGPSAMFQYGDHAFALTTGVRYMTSGNRIPYEIPIHAYEQLKYEPLQNISFDDYNTDISTQAWMEIGLSYAYDVYHSFSHQITVGASLKFLWGYAGAYAEVNNAKYIVLNDTTLNIQNLNATAGFALPVDYNNNDMPMHDPFFKGKGMGFDIGVTYTKRKYVDNKRFEKPCAQRYEDYIYRIGVSIIDIGRVKYKNNAQMHGYDDVSVFWQNFDTINFDNVNKVVSELSDLFYGDPDSSYRASEIKIGLPMAVSVQFDYHFDFKEEFYVGAMWIQPVRFNMHTLRRPAQLAIVPRWETKNFEFSLPLSLFEYRYPRVGFAARFYFFTIGTERIGTYLGIADLNGMDLYFSFKFSFGKGSCRKKPMYPCANTEFGYSDKEKAKFRKRKW